MKKIVLILTLFAGCFSFVSGQTAADSITVTKTFGGYHFYQGKKHLNMNKLVNALKTNDAAYQQILSAQSANSMTILLSFAGGLMVGWPAVTTFTGGDPNWGLAVAGAACIAISIPVTKSANRKAKQAVDTFNSGLPTSSVSNTAELRLSMTGNGVGLVLRF